MKSFYLAVVIVAIFSVSLSCQDLTADQIALKQKLLVQPPPGILKLSEKRASHQQPTAIDVPLVLNADLDGSGMFSYFIAFFTSNSSGG